MDGECLACGDNGYLYMFQAFFGCTEMEVSWNGGTPKSSILIGFSIINHPAIGVPPWQWKPPYVLTACLAFYLGLCVRPREPLTWGEKNNKCHSCETWHFLQPWLLHIFFYNI
jgi:hypothetical protein